MRRRIVLAVVAMTLVFLLGVTAAVSVAGSAAALGQPSTTTSSGSGSMGTDMTTTGTGPADQFLAVNGTVNAASDHEIVGSSAFPNFTTGAVDNYYSMAHAHVDNSPFAEGTASPLDTGPIGQTAAAGNFQQSQYADARWPGGPDSATFGSQGGPYAKAAASDFKATADASEPSNGLKSPGFRMPAGFDLRLAHVLAAWKATWLSRLSPKRPTTPVTPPKVTATVPKAPVAPPAPKIKTPVATVTVPRTTAGSGAPAPVPAPSAPSPPTPRTLASASSSGDGESALTSSTKAELVPVSDIPKTDTHKIDTTSTDTTSTTTTPDTTTGTKGKKSDKVKRYALVTSGESSLGRVSMGGGQIVIEGIHVKASITNDGSPAYSAKVSIASATIGGIPVTIDDNGVHIAGQGQALPYKQASDSLNNALKQAGIQLFLVGPEITTNSCGQSGTGSGGGMPQSTTTTSTDQSSGASSCGGFGMSSSSSCDQTGSGTGTGTSTGATTTSAASPSPAPPLPGQSTDTTSSGSAPPPSCAGMGTTSGSSGSCSAAGTGTGTTTPSNSSTAATTTTPGALYPPGSGTGTNTTTTTMGTNDQMGASTGMPSSEEVILTATGLHVVFTQPVSPPGAPAQNVEHILGEVYVDSLATPAGPVGPLPNLGLNSSSPSSSSAVSSCGGSGGKMGASGSGASLSGGSSSAGGSGSSGALSPTGSGYGSASGSQPGSSAGSTGNSLPAAFASALHKPLWLLLAYLLWQSLVVGTALSLWNWRRGGGTS